MAIDTSYVSLRRDRPMTVTELVNINERHCVIGKVVLNDGVIAALNAGSVSFGWPGADLLDHTDGEFV
jgi:hypothetical protein